MRVIAGKYKGKRLVAPKGFDARPTADRVKESLFSILRDEIIDSDFLDLFAGSGNVGIEALSRGTHSATFIDKNRISIKSIIANLERCELQNAPNVTVLRMEAIKALGYFSKRNSVFDIIFLDPPYHSELLEKSLHKISDCGILSQTGTIVAEHHRSQILPDKIGQIRLVRQKQYGDTMLSFYYLNA